MVQKSIKLIEIDLNTHRQIGSRSSGKKQIKKQQKQQLSKPGELGYIKKPGTAHLQRSQLSPAMVGEKLLSRQSEFRFLLVLYLSLPTFHFTGTVVERTSIALNAHDVRQPTGITAETIRYTGKSSKQEMKLLMWRCEQESYVKIQAVQHLGA